MTTRCWGYNVLQGFGTHRVFTLTADVLKVAKVVMIIGRGID